MERPTGLGNILVHTDSQGVTREWFRVHSGKWHLPDTNYKTTQEYHETGSVWFLWDGSQKIDCDPVLRTLLSRFDYPNPA
jgi:hypothetical protein